MSRMTLLSLAIAACVAGGCKKKSTEGEAAGTATGSGTATAAPQPEQRPSQGALQAMPPIALPDDPARAAKVALGNALFFDKRLSVDGSRACYSCHLNENGTGGADPIAIGPGDKKLTRHSPVLWNLGYAKGAFYWDGRAPSLEAVAKGAWAGGNMGVGEDKLEAKAGEIGKIKGYQPLFKAAFGDDAANAERVQSALAEYIRTFVCADTAYDKFAKGEKSALSEEQQRGLDVFLGKGQCSACHTPPHFSISMQVDGGVYFNAGVGTDKPEPEVDVGRMKVTNNATDWAAFKVPSLRNVSKTAPYFHDGSAATLADAVTYMSHGAKPNKNLSALLASKNLTDAETADVVKFLESLECTGKLEEPKLP
ncbi:MAG TPA: cytochrome c peroxidase [Kofleriaceae bacterium]|nr:cytochrome c peroxidase [Kofleriaceae bacterium]